MVRISPRIFIGLALLFFLPAQLPAAETFRIATYNVENYLDQASGSRPAKSEAAKGKVREGILALKPDVLALQEIGGTNVLLELQRSLKSCGLDLPNWELITGYDTNIHVAILSRFAITARHPQTNDFFLMNGSRFRVSRGFAEVDIQVNSNYSFTLITAHLKSRRPIPEADEADLRLEEAKVLREKIDARLAADPNVNLIVLGDFNDLHDSHPIKTIIGRGKKGLIDTRPAERNGDSEAQSDRRLASRNIAWTHFYAKEDTYSRIDYILLSHGMAREWDPAGTYVLALPNWGLGSDHRPLVAAFIAEDR
ncbi:MAG TPA: endonuclease/exonuclease/phosphatase family protein [Verrucomicrobiae bacterium]|nr:endonuclease/exonuclease/phosphatase family protein [Verrucomicrobiae bacterium]